jgi:hypothetical protein
VFLDAFDKSLRHEDNVYLNECGGEIPFFKQYNVMGGEIMLATKQCSFL